jgi:hypothetical protein
VVRASDKRAQFVGIEAYQSAGGTVMRDLFQQDDGGWPQDPVLLDRLVAEKLERASETVRAEGWKWLEVATDFPCGHTYGLRHVAGESVAMSEEEIAAAEGLRAEYEQLEQAHADADELPQEVDQRLGEIETALAALDERPVKYDPEEIARAGAFVSIDISGALRVERGYVRPEDEPAVPDSEPENLDCAVRLARAAQYAKHSSPRSKAAATESGSIVVLHRMRDPHTDGNIVRNISAVARSLDAARSTETAGFRAACGVDWRPPYGAHLVSARCGLRLMPSGKLNQI